MENELELIERIDSYLANELSSEERFAFEKLMADDPEIRKKVDNTRAVIEGLQDYELKQQFKKLHKKHASEGKVVNLSRKYWISGIAAAVLALIVSTFLLFDKGSNPQQLFSDNFAPYPDIYSSRGADNESSFEKAMELYSRGNYSNAILQFDLAEGSSIANTDYINFYKGLSYLAMGDANSAFPLFEIVQDSRLFEQANWYIGLSLLKQGNTKETVERLKKIEKGQFNYDQAQELLAELED